MLSCSILLVLISHVVVGLSYHFHSIQLQYWPRSYLFNMCVCVCVCVCVCAHTHTYIHTHTKHAYNDTHTIHVHTYIITHTTICMHEWTHSVITQHAVVDTDTHSTIHITHSTTHITQYSTIHITHSTIHITQYNTHYTMIHILLCIYT